MTDRHIGSYGLTSATIQQVISVYEAYKKLFLSVFNNSFMNSVSPDYQPNTSHIVSTFPTFMLD